MGVVSKGDMRYLFGVVVLEYLCSGGEGLFRGQNQFDGDYFHLEKSTGFTFLYQDEQVAAVKNLTLRFTNERLSVVLTKCLAGTDLEWSIEDKTIVLKRQEKAKAPQQQVKSRKITGQVKDETGQPLPGVTVMLEGTKWGRRPRGRTR